MFDPWLILQRRIEDSLRPYELEPIAVHSADHDANGAFARDAGLADVLDMLRSAVVDRKVPPAILLIGILPVDEMRARLVKLVGTDSLFDWPGQRYLRYIFTTDELLSAASSALSGRLMPVPLPTPQELLSSIANVLHWLEQVKQGHAGTARILTDVARGEFELPRRNLEPEPCLSPKQRERLELLCQSLSLAIEMENSKELAETLRNDIIAQDVASLKLEQLKSAYDSSRVTPNTGGLQALAATASALAEKATALFERVGHIEAQIVERAAGQND